MKNVLYILSSLTGNLAESESPDRTFHQERCTLKIEEAAKRMGKSKQFVRVALQQGLFNWGVATKVSGDKYSYYINEASFKRYMEGADHHVRDAR